MKNLRLHMRLTALIVTWVVLGICALPLVAQTADKEAIGRQKAAAGGSAPAMPWDGGAFRAIEVTPHSGTNPGASDQNAGSDSCSAVSIGADFGNSLFADDFETGNTAVWGNDQTYLSASQITDLHIQVELDAMVGDHLLTVRFTTPRGHHYQTLDLPLASGSNAAPGERAVAGYPRPLAVQAIGSAAAQSQATLSLPVAGTSITSGSLYGEWLVEAFFDGNDTPCATTQFNLRR